MSVWNMGFSVAAPAPWAQAWEINMISLRFFLGVPAAGRPSARLVKSGGPLAARNSFATQALGDMVAPFRAFALLQAPMDQDLKATLSRIAEALDRLAPPPEPPARRPPPAPPSADINGAEAYVWQAAGHRLEAVIKVNRVDLALLQ